ncbi:hypothetical protein ACOSQ3_010807 [Xanthoceras sorbifolium]
MMETDEILNLCAKLSLSEDDGLVVRIGAKIQEDGLKEVSMCLIGKIVANRKVGNPSGNASKPNNDGSTISGEDKAQQNDAVVEEMEVHDISASKGCISGVSLESVCGNDSLADERVLAEGYILIDDLSSVHQEVQIVEKREMAQSCRSQWWGLFQGCRGLQVSGLGANLGSQFVDSEAVSRLQCSVSGTVSRAISGSQISDSWVISRLVGSVQAVASSLTRWYESKKKENARELKELREELSFYYTGGAK